MDGPGSWSGGQVGAATSLVHARSGGFLGPHDAECGWMRQGLRLPITAQRPKKPRYGRHPPAGARV
jgi:hypothetical protein